MKAEQILGLKADILGTVRAKVEDIFIEFQDAMEIKSGDVTPLDAYQLQWREENLADIITEILIAQKTEIPLRGEKE